MTQQPLSTVSANKGDTVLKLQEILTDLLTLENGLVITENSRLQEDLAIDSLALVDFVVALEDNFGVKLPSTFNAADIKTVGDAADLILALKAAQEANHA